MNINAPVMITGEKRATGFILNLKRGVSQSVKKGAETQTCGERNASPGENVPVLL